MRLDGLVADLVDLADWSLPRLRARFGDRTVAAIPTAQGRMRCDDQTGMAFQTVRFADYIDALDRTDHPNVYLATPGNDWLNGLRDCIATPDYCQGAHWSNTRLWISAPGTLTPLHHDLAENIFLQLVGRKRFLLYPPAASPWLYSYPFASALPNYSRVDPENIDEQRFPLSRAVSPIEVVLEPGEALYLPSRWWHHVRTLDVSVSYNFWFADNLLALIVRSAEFVKRIRHLEIYGLEARLRAMEFGSPPPAA